MAEKLVKLKCLHDYVNPPRQLHFRKGDVAEVPAEVAAFLMRDAPACFQEVKGKAVRKPAKDKMVKGPGKDK